MKADGSDQTQITKINGGIPMYADTQWVYYTHGLDRTLWRVSVTTGVEELVMNKAPGRGRFVFSPGGDLVAYIDLRDGKPVMVIDSIPDGAELRSATLDDTGRIELAWVPDESAVAYSISQPDGTNTLWIQPMDGSERYRSADLGEDQVIYLSFLTEKDSIGYVQGRWKHDFVMLTGFQ
jgi:Tol biopolymer transport system component